MDIIIKLLVAGGVMGLLDWLWLGFVAKGLYYGEMGKLLLEKPKMIPALIFYAVYVIGVVVFVVNPALAKGSLLQAIGFGALFGLVAYATYDLTNLATMKDFSAKIAILDIVWGAVLTATMAGITYVVVDRWMA